MLFTVQFGHRFTGLNTVGYTLYNINGTLRQARIAIYNALAAVPSGERGAGTGTYGADIALPNGFSGEIRWDTGAIPLVTLSDTIDGGGELSTNLLSGALTSIALVKALPGIGTYTDEQISNAINAATAQIESYCDRHFSSASYTAEAHDGNSRFDTIYTLQWPIAEITAVVMDGEILPASEYEVLEESIWRLGGWLSGRRNIQVTYTAGYSSIPADLSMTAAKIVADMLSTAPVNSNIKSEKIGDYSYTLGDTATTAVSKYKGELASYRRW